MNIKRDILAGVIAAASFFIPLFSSAQQIHPLTKAMLDGYDELLRQNPNDWFTLYERASQYYRLSDYDKALSDILKSIECTPAKEKDQLVSEYSLASDIYVQMEDYEKALRQADAGLALNPGSYPLLYQKGNICLYLKDVREAGKCFSSMLRLKSRSQEAMFGLAKCAILEGNYSEARTYMEQAEKLDRSNYITFCRLGDLYADMDEIQNAAAAYLSAFSLNSGDERPLSSLLALGKCDYNVVAEAIDYGVSKTSNTVPLLFIKGNIAKEANKFDDAYDAYSKLLKTSGGDMPEVLSTMAEICRAKNSLTEALGYADRAVSLSDASENKLLKASIDCDLDNYVSAKKLCESVLQGNPNDVEAMLLGARIAVATDEPAEAAEYLDSAIGENPTDHRPLLLRAYVAEKYGLTSLPGNSDYARASHLVADSDFQTVYKAIAQFRSGKALDASTTMDKIMSKSSADPLSAYLTALFHANTGNVAKGKEALENARKLGFENKYLLDSYSVPMLSVVTLR